MFLNKEKESKVTLWGRSGEGSVVVFYLSNGVGFLCWRFWGGTKGSDEEHITYSGGSKIKYLAQCG